MNADKILIVWYRNLLRSNTECTLIFSNKNIGIMIYIALRYSAKVNFVTPVCKYVRVARKLKINGPILLVLQISNLTTLIKMCQKPDISWHASSCAIN